MALALAAVGGSLPSLAQQSGLEEITVTARFREENLQETPLAITAFSGENMEARNLTDVTMIDTFSPNTIIQPLGAGWGSTAAAFIRGIGLGLIAGAVMAWWFRNYDLGSPPSFAGVGSPKWSLLM